MQIASTRSAVVAGGVFAAAIVAATAFVVWDMRFRLAPDAVADLPAEATVALARNMDAAAWQRVIPVLNLPTLPSPLPRDAALLRLPSGATEWVPLTPGTRQIAGASPETAALLTAVERPLQRTPLLSRGVPPEPHLVLGHEALPLVTGSDTTVLLRLGQDGGVALEWEGPRVPRSPAQTLGSLPAAAGALRLFVREPPRAAALLSSLLPKDLQTVARALALTAAGQIAGVGVSPEHDLLPHALQSLTLERTASGTVAYGIGEAGIRDDLLERLHAPLGADGAERITERTKEGFTVDVLRPGTPPPAAKRRTADGWAVRTSARGSGSMATAVRGKELLIATDAALLDGALARIAAADAALIAAGTVPDTLLSPLAIGLLPAVRLQTLLSALERPASAPVEWTLREQAGIWTLGLVVR